MTLKELLEELVSRSGSDLHLKAGSPPVARIDGMGELNIGHSIVARAVLVGFTEAVREMKRLIA